MLTEVSLFILLWNLQKEAEKIIALRTRFPFQVLNDIVLGDLKQIIRNVENLQELVKSQSFTATKIRKSTDIELTKLKAELERVKKLKKSIYEDYKDELISKEEFLSYREDYQQKETLYSKQIVTLEEKKKESVTEDVFETPWFKAVVGTERTLKN